MLTPDGTGFTGLMVTLSSPAGRFRRRNLPSLSVVAVAGPAAICTPANGTKVKLWLSSMFAAFVFAEFNFSRELLVLVDCCEALGLFTFNKTFPEMERSARIGMSCTTVETGLTWMVTVSMGAR